MELCCTASGQNNKDWAQTCLLCELDTTETFNKGYCAFKKLRLHFIQTLLFGNNISKRNMPLLLIFLFKTNIAIICRNINKNPQKPLHVSRLKPLLKDVGLHTEELVWKAKHAELIQLDAREFTNLRRWWFQDPTNCWESYSNLLSPVVRKRINYMKPFLVVIFK